MSEVCSSGGRSVAIFDERRRARGLLLGRVAIDPEAAARVTGGGLGVSALVATGSFNLLPAFSSPEEVGEGVALTG